MRIHRSLSGLLAVLLLSTAFLGCDSNDDGVEPSEVSGVYTFNILSFEATAAVIGTVNVLNYIDAQQTTLELFNDGDFSLRYVFNSGPQGVASGSFSVTDSRVTLRVDESDEDEFEALLLDPRLRLDRQGTSLNATLSKTANLESLDPDAFDTLEEQAGTLTVRLTRR